MRDIFLNGPKPITNRSANRNLQLSQTHIISHKKLRKNAKPFASAQETLATSKSKVRNGESCRRVFDPRNLQTNAVFAHLLNIA